jgi:hypothetical protein
MHSTPALLAAIVLGSAIVAVPAQAQTTSCSGQPAAGTEMPKLTPNFSAGQEAWLAGKLALAVTNFRPLAEDGDAKAQGVLGQILLHGGCGVTADKPEGIKWLRKSAQAHDVTGEYLFAQALLNGDGVQEDDATAFDWAKRSALKGNPPAQVGVGYLYFTGRGVKRDYQQAIRWTVMAGEQGAPVALSNIAKSYLSGSGIPKDLHRAMFWISAAIARVPPNQWQMTQRFLQTRYTIARQLSVEDVKKIEQESEKWSPGKGSLADVLADTEKWKATGSASPADADVADH